MQIEALKIYCDVVRMRSFSKGAEQSGVTQSTASQTVQHLEEHLGVQLIDRSRRPFELTNEGRYYYEGCKKILERFQRLETRVKDLNRGVVNVTSIYSSGMSVVNQLVNDFNRQHQNDQVHLHFRQPSAVLNSVLSGEAEIGILSFPQERKELEILPWREEKMVWVLPPKHPLVGQIKIELEDFQKMRFVHFDRELFIRRAIDQYLKSIGLQLEIGLELDNIEAIKRAVESGAGLGLLPEPTVEKELSTGSLVALELTTPVMVRPLALIRKSGASMKPVVEEFTQKLLKDQYLSVSPAV